MVPVSKVTINNRDRRYHALSEERLRGPVFWCYKSYADFTKSLCSINCFAQNPKESLYEEYSSLELQNIFLSPFFYSQVRSLKGKTGCPFSKFFNSCLCSESILALNRTAPHTVWLPCRCRCRLASAHCPWEDLLVGFDPVQLTQYAPMHPTEPVINDIRLHQHDLI